MEEDIKVIDDVKLKGRCEICGRMSDLFVSQTQIICGKCVDDRKRVFARKVPQREREVTPFNSFRIK